MGKYYHPLLPASDAQIPPAEGESRGAKSEMSTEMSMTLVGEGTEGPSKMSGRRKKRSMEEEDERFILIPILLANDQYES